MNDDKLRVMQIIRNLEIGGAQPKIGSYPSFSRTR